MFCALLGQATRQHFLTTCRFVYRALVCEKESPIIFCFLCFFLLFSRFCSHSDTRALVTMLAMASNVTPRTDSLCAFSSSIVKLKIPWIHCPSVAIFSKQRNRNLTLANPSNAYTVPTIRAQASLGFAYFRISFFPELFSSHSIHHIGILCARL